MAVYRRPTRARYVLALLVLASITLVTLDARGYGPLGKVRSDGRAVLDPITHATHSALAPVGNFLTGAAEYGSLEKENDRLRAQIAGMQSESSVTASAEAEASQIIAQAKLPFATNLPSVPALVVGQNPENYDVAFEIDKGTSDGVAAGYPVVTQAGLVGTVAEATAHQATVLVLTDPNFAAGVDIGGTGYDAQGAGPTSPLQVDDVPSATSVARGQLLTTSGLALENFPPGIPVGKVTSVTSSPGSLEKTVSIGPLINPNKLLVVNVLIYSGQTP